MARIVLETSKATSIDNTQGDELSATHLKWCKKLKEKHPKATPRTEFSNIYNCHGFTFASRRTWITRSKDIMTIIKDDNYCEIEMGNLKPGDIVIYYSEKGDPNHSGIVVEFSTSLPIICSKWGFAGEFLHGLNDYPDLYGPIVKFYRCKL